MLQYQIGSGLVLYSPHANFVVVTSPVVNHQLCGDLDIQATYNNAPVDGTVLSYDPSGNQFSVNSDNSSLIGQTRPYALIAQFVNYPKDTYSSASKVVTSNFIEFDSPCLSATIFVSSQNDASPDKYTGNAVTVQINRFSVSPSGCPIAYACTSVARLDG